MAAVPDGDTTTDHLVNDIIAKGYKSVAVLPRFIVRQLGEPEELGGSIGPLADLLADSLESDLTHKARGRVQVAGGPQMEKAFKHLSLSDLSDRKALKGLAAAISGGLDALVVGKVLDERNLGHTEGDVGPALTVNSWLLDLNDGTSTGRTKQSTKITLGDAAYMGESWELRRWTDRGLVNVGLKAEENSVSPFGDGLAYSAEQFKLIRGDRPHPLEDPEFPYPVSIWVRRQKRELIKIKKDFYCALDPSESYAIQIKNTTTRPAYVAFFVDGINTRGKMRESPESCLYWRMEAGASSEMSGWYTDGPTGKNMKKEDFEIIPESDGIAIGQGFGEALGQITIVCYTVGRDDIPAAPTLKTPAPSGVFATGGRKAHDVAINRIPGPPLGLILSAVTIRYKTTSQLRKLQEKAAAR
jgi:hypothetical protein